MNQCQFGLVDNNTSRIKIKFYFHAKDLPERNAKLNLRVIVTLRASRSLICYAHLRGFLFDKRPQFNPLK